MKVEGNSAENENEDKLNISKNNSRCNKYNKQRLEFKQIENISIFTKQRSIKKYINLLVDSIEINYNNGIIQSISVNIKFQDLSYRYT